MSDMGLDPNDPVTMALIQYLTSGGAPSVASGGLPPGAVPSLSMPQFFNAQAAAPMAQFNDDGSADPLSPTSQMNYLQDYFQMQGNPLAMGGSGMNGFNPDAFQSSVTESTIPTPGLDRINQLATKPNSVEGWIAAQVKGGSEPSEIRYRLSQLLAQYKENPDSITDPNELAVVSTFPTYRDAGVELPDLDYVVDFATGLQSAAAVDRGLATAGEDGATREWMTDEQGFPVSLIERLETPSAAAQPYLEAGLATPDQQMTTEYLQGDQWTAQRDSYLDWLAQSEAAPDQQYEQMRQRQQQIYSAATAGQTDPTQQAATGGTGAPAAGGGGGDGGGGAGGLNWLDLASIPFMPSPTFWAIQGLQQADGPRNAIGDFFGGIPGAVAGSLSMPGSGTAAALNSGPMAPLGGVASSANILAGEGGLSGLAADAMGASSGLANDIWSSIFGGGEAGVTGATGSAGQTFPGYGNLRAQQLAGQGDDDGLTRDEASLLWREQNPNGTPREYEQWMIQQRSEGWPALAGGGQQQAVTPGAAPPAPAPPAGYQAPDPATRDDAARRWLATHPGGTPQQFEEWQRDQMANGWPALGIEDDRRALGASGRGQGSAADFAAAVPRLASGMPVSEYQNQWLQAAGNILQQRESDNDHDDALARLLLQRSGRGSEDSYGYATQSGLFPSVYDAHPAIAEAMSRLWLEQSGRGQEGRTPDNPSYPATGQTLEDMSKVWLERSGRGQEPTNAPNASSSYGVSDSMLDEMSRKWLERSGRGQEQIDLPNVGGDGFFSGAVDRTVKAGERAGIRKRLAKNKTTAERRHRGSEVYDYDYGRNAAVSYLMQQAGIRPLDLQLAARNNAMRSMGLGN